MSKMIFGLEMIVRSKEELRGDTQNIAYVMKKCLYKDMEHEIHNSQLFVMKSWLLYYCIDR